MAAVSPVEQTATTDTSAVVVGAEATLKSAKTWDVYGAPPSNSVKGSFVPSVISKSRRRISVEIHRLKAEDPDPDSKKKVTENDYYEEVYIRILSPVDKSEKRSSKKRGQLSRKSGVSYRSSLHINDDGSVMPTEGDDNTLAGFHDHDDLSNLASYDGWKAKYKLPLKALRIKNVNKCAVSIGLEYISISQTRTIWFDLEEDATDFVQYIDVQRQEQQRRNQVKMKHALGNLKVSPSERFTFLVEIVSGTNLPAADLLSSDPYVKCFLNGVEVHKTDHIPQTLNPVWTLKTNSLFLAQTSAKDLFEGDGLHCDLYDYDTLGKNDKLGSVVIPPMKLYQANGERVSHDLKGEDARGSLAIRVRRATPYDIRFMRDFEEIEKNKGGAPLDQAMKKASQTKGGKSGVASVLGKNKKTEKHGLLPPVVKYKARPGPDPLRAEETTWLTEKEIDAEVLKESTQWIDTGSGDVARLFVEVLGCDGLPNLDTGGFLGNKTDAFVALVFEDAWAQTDVISDCLSPRWFPWSKRGFIFHMFHSSSELYVGVFDYDGGFDNHDLIGRVAVDVSNMVPDTVYMLTYDIYPSGVMKERKKRGTVTLRVRLETDDSRKLLLSCLRPPPQVYVNVKTKKDFNVITSAVKGSIDTEAYSMSVLTSFVDELTSYSDALLYIEDSVITLLFWRGHFQLELNGKVYLLPIHSAVAFILGVMLVERPQLMPSFFFASIAWLLLATQLYRRHDPSPWNRCKGFLELSTNLVTGKAYAPARIARKENIEKIREHQQMWETRKAKIAEAAEKSAKETQEAKAKAQKELEEIGETNNDISTKKGGISIDPFKTVLAPIQQILGVVCQILRYVRNILVWQECYLSFWLTVGCLVLSVVCLFVPWFFVIRWTSRIVVWAVFGPHMKLVDMYYYTPLENMTDEEKQKAKEEQQLKHAEAHQEAVLQARIDREDAQKLKEMKKFMFGKYITKVPVLKQDRWYDVPLLQSKAAPHNPPPLGLADLAMKEAGYHRVRVPGQSLEGKMIPSIESKSFTEAPVGQATKKHSEKESDSAAYAKIGSLVVGAGVLTYFGMPFISNLAETVLGG